MAWEHYTPKTKKRGKSARVTLLVSNKSAWLIMNNILVKELGLTRLIQCARLRYDKERNCIGATFHYQPTSTRVKNNSYNRVGNRRAADGTVSRTINVTELLHDMHGELPDNATYHLNYHRENDNILVLDLNSLKVDKS